MLGDGYTILIIVLMHMKNFGGILNQIAALGFVVLMMIIMSPQKWMSGPLLIRTVNERRRFIIIKDIQYIPKGMILLFGV